MALQAALTITIEMIRDKALECRFDREWSAVPFFKYLDELQGKK